MAVGFHLGEAERKAAGAYYTPEYAVRSLVTWAVRSRSDRLLDPACGDGRFLTVHGNSVGVEQDAGASALVHARAPGSLIHEGDFFRWATTTKERFECAAGNPPFIRYQKFAGDVRLGAQRLCERHGAVFSSLSSSWAPFVVATSTLLKPGGRLALIVPAEIGHATYARTTLEFLASHFALVHIVAVQRRIFPELSEDCWVLYAEGYGGTTGQFLLSKLTQFGFMPRPPRADEQISLADWRSWNCRLRPFLVGANVRSSYQALGRDPAAYRLADIAEVGIGYVTGANDFFHLRPSEAGMAGIPARCLRPSVRNGRYLPPRAVTEETLQSWIRDDEPILLLQLDPRAALPARVKAYLDSPKGQSARLSYKCREREPWYVVPDITVPQAFLSYMSNDRPALVGNEAGCTCTNAVHAVRLKKRIAVKRLQRTWDRPLTQLSCELEGHPLGGGLLKLEPREAGRVLILDGPPLPRSTQRAINEGIMTLQAWRHRA